jgi:hypothetical protein
MQPHSRKGVFTMTIEIHQPELEALIHERMQSGAFASVEDVLLQALRGSASPKPLPNGVTGLTGAVIVAAMQACPYPDFDFEMERFPMTIRDPEF